MTISYLSQDLFPGNTQRLTRADVSIQRFHPAVELAPLRIGYRDLGWDSGQAGPDSVKQVELLFGAQLAEVKCRFRHRPTGLILPLRFVGSNRQRPPAF
jgi:hypothetical protein